MSRTAERSLSNGGGMPDFDGLIRVLVADDLRENRLVLRGYLNRSYLKIVEAEDGIQALAALRASPFDLPSPVCRCRG